MWVADLPDGEARLLAESKEEQQGGVEGFHRPHSWSPDGRYLVGGVDYFEGGGNLLWDINSGQSRDLDIFGYVGPRWDLGWLADNTALIAATGAGSGRGALSLISTGFRDVPEPTPIHFVQWPQDYTADNVVAIGAQGLYAGEGIGFAVRQADSKSYPGNGVFRVGEDGSGLRALVGLPDAHTYESGGLDHRLVGELTWSPLGQAFLFFDADPDAQGLIPAILGRSDGSGAWDVREVLGDASHVAWGREGAN